MKNQALKSLVLKGCYAYFIGFRALSKVAKIFMYLAASALDKVPFGSFVHVIFILAFFLATCDILLVAHLAVTLPLAPKTSFIFTGTFFFP